jgi:hypothetical protein
LSSTEKLELHQYFCDAGEKMVELFGGADKLSSVECARFTFILKHQEIHSMRSFILIVALVALAALMGICVVSAQDGDGVRRITPEEARQAVESGKAIIVDVRDEASYKAGHVKGARWILADDIGSRIKELPRDKMIITYCS